MLQTTASLHARDYCSIAFQITAHCMLQTTASLHAADYCSIAYCRLLLHFRLTCLFTSTSNLHRHALPDPKGDQLIYSLELLLQQAWRWRERVIKSKKAEKRGPYKKSVYIGGSLSPLQCTVSITAGLTITHQLFSNCCYHYTLYMW